jgi:hypothetical protein
MSNAIHQYLDELIKSIGGVNPPIDYAILLKLYERRDYPAMLGWIKNSMYLNIGVALRIVNGSETSAPMWIEMPNPMPRYGSVEFRRARVVVNARRDILETKPFAFVVAGFAHELSHVVLCSTGHRLQRNEKAVDLTAMVLGYQRFISDAEVTKTEGALSSALLMLLLLPFGLFFWAGTRTEKLRIGYLTSSEAIDGLQYLARIEHGLS